MISLKSWAFQRPFCTPTGGFVLARTAPEAISLIHFAHGYCSNTKVFCAETGREYTDEPSSYAPEDFLNENLSKTKSV